MEYVKGNIQVVKKKRYMKQYERNVEKMERSLKYKKKRFMDSEEKEEIMGKRRYKGGV